MESCITAENSTQLYIVLFSVYAFLDATQSVVQSSFYIYVSAYKNVVPFAVYVFLEGA